MVSSDVSYLKPLYVTESHFMSFCIHVIFSGPIFMQKRRTLYGRQRSIDRLRRIERTKEENRGMNQAIKRWFVHNNLRDVKTIKAISSK